MNGSAEGYRGAVIVLTLLDTGLRINELINLRMENVWLQEGLVKVLGKGNKERLVPIGKQIRQLLWRYITQYRPEPARPNLDNLFLTHDGGPLTKNRLETIIKNLGRKAGLQGVRCSPHTFKHTFCIQFLRNGANLFSLQQMTGHSSLEVLRGYVTLAESDLKIAHQKFSPADNLNLRMPYLSRKGRRID